MLSRFHAYQNVTDRQTDGQTELLPVYQYRVSMLTRDKNDAIAV